MNPYFGTWFLARALSLLVCAIVFALLSSDSTVEICGIAICLSLLAGWEWRRWRGRVRQ